MPFIRHLQNSTRIEHRSNPQLAGILASWRFC